MSSWVYAGAVTLALLVGAGFVLLFKIKYG